MSRSSQLQPGLLQALQHPAVCNDQQAIATLLCTSKQLASAVHAHCGGLVPVQCFFNSLQQALSLAKWITANGSQVGFLNIGPYNPVIQIGPRRDAATAAIAQALVKAASSPQGLMLQQVVLSEVSNSPALLQQLSYSSQLTGLTLLLPRGNNSTAAPLNTAVPAADLVPALAGLTSLRSLTLHTKWHHKETSTDSLIPALNSLSNLSSLTIGEPQHPADLQHLPVQLQQLQLIQNEQNEQISGSRLLQRKPLRLGHLTALTSIACCRPRDLWKPCSNSNRCPDEVCRHSFEVLQMPVDSSIYLQGHDQLPPVLMDLTVNSVSSGAIPQLQHLRRLVLTGNSTFVARLPELAKHNSQLTSLQLNIEDSQWQSAAALQSLPVTDLRLHLHSAAGADLQLLAATSKTLTLLAFNSTVTADAVVLASVVQQLTGLRKLMIRFAGVPMNEFPQSSDAEDAYGQHFAPVADQQGAGGPGNHVDQQLLSAVASLQQLRCFAYHSGCLYSSYQVYSPLTAATQLTALQLRYCGLEDKSVGVLAASLTGLRELDIAGNRHVTCRVVPLISKGLRQLTYLNLCGTLVNEVNVSSIPQVSSLRMGSLKVKHTARSWRDTVMDLDE